jgi:hypothetical protein
MSKNNKIFYIQIDKTGNDMTTVSRCSNQFFVDIELLEKNNKCLKIHVSKYGNGKDNFRTSFRRRDTDQDYYKRYI